MQNENVLRDLPETFEKKARLSWLRQLDASQCERSLTYPLAFCVSLDLAVSHGFDLLLRLTNQHGIEHRICQPKHTNMKHTFLIQLQHAIFVRID